MNRDAHLKRLRDASRVWDVLVIGGGASGLGVAVDAAARGYSTALVEQHDFAKGTSSRSTKLIHGGVRYLRQGHIGLVREALHERGLLRRLAPHLVRDLAFVVPNYDWWEGPFYGLGFKLYDALAGDLGIAPSRTLSRKQTLARIPNVQADGLKGGVIYHDAQFDDARLAISLARTCADLGGAPANYLKVVRLLKSKNRVCGVVVRDEEDPSHPLIELHARVVINATGVFGDAIRRLDQRAAIPLARPSQGVHLVLDRSFLPGHDAIMVPHTEDGRVLFAVPWHDRVLLGTTDTAVPKAQLEPAPLEAEINYLLRHAARYLDHAPKRDDVLSMFAGLRPLFSARRGSPTAALSREHYIEVSPSGLVTVTGGKWTTYRRMGADVVDKAAVSAGLPERAVQTESLRLHGWTTAPALGALSVYGAEATDIEALAKADPELARPLHPRLPYRGAEIVWAARHEMAQTVEDALSRRTRALLLDVRASVEAAPAAAALLARERGFDRDWIDREVTAFARLARRYLP
ncbi:MAG TPA: glycerol-3-phosphate dehydrogenase/oxidase [Kiritimatiellia bacterium]|nr:glycerol-3-phosphate dehydrogenase/oxidase [Kiritimatiellia bacterium]